MSNAQDDFPQMDVEAGISEEERTEIRNYIDRVATLNRIGADEARFNGRGARRGILVPLAVNVAAVLGVLIGILILRSAFLRDEQQVQRQASQYSSIEGRLIRELQAESQALLFSKEQEIERVRGQLLALETEQAVLESEFAERIATREQELRLQIEAEIASERARLIAEGLNNEQIDRLMQEFEAQREAYYEQQMLEYRNELEAERRALEADIQRLRNEYQQRLTALQSERDSLIAEFREREDDLRVQLEQRTRVLEIARVEASAGLESAQRELAERERATRELESVERQITGQIDSIQAAVRAGNQALVIERIDALVAYLGEEQVTRFDALARRRETDLFLLRQLRSLVAASIEQDDTRSITQELRLIGQIRRLSEEASDASTEEDELARLNVLLQTIPEVAEAHQQVVRQARIGAVEEAREIERDSLAAGAAQAATLSAAGAYDAALGAYVQALESLPSVAPDVDRIVSDVLRLGYAMTEYVVDGRRGEELAGIAARASVDLVAERAALERRIANAVSAAVAAREAQLNLEIARLNAIIVAAGTERPDASPTEPSGIVAMTEAELRALTDQSEAVVAERDSLALELRRTRAELSTTERERAALELQRDELIDERVALRRRYAEYAQDQESAIERADFVALANARDAFFLSSELDLFMPGLTSLIDQYDRQYTAEQESVGLSSFQVNEVIEELSAPLTAAQRSALLANAIANAREDGDANLVAFLGLLFEMVEAVASAQ